MIYVKSIYHHRKHQRDLKIINLVYRTGIDLVTKCNACKCSSSVSRDDTIFAANMSCKGRREMKSFQNLTWLQLQHQKCNRTEMLLNTRNVKLVFAYLKWNIVVVVMWQTFVYVYLSVKSAFSQNM